jgi:predicted  nucleic acid-binding Zn-ribbon protein
LPLYKHMKKISERLWTLQSKLSQRGVDASTKEDLIRELRQGIPEAVLARVDQSWTRGKKAVASVRRGVCTECHIQVPKALLIALTIDGGTHLCGNCGRYLYLSEEESIGLLKGPVKDKPASTKRKKLLAHVH